MLQGRLQKWAVLVVLLVYFGGFVFITHVYHSRVEAMWGLFQKAARDADTRNFESEYTTDGAKKFVLLTYMRSGSTFSGELFNQYPGAFYHFEPMRAIIAAVTGNIFSVDREKLNRKRNESDMIYARAVKNMLNCEHDQLPVGVFVDPFMSPQSDRYLYLSNEEYLKCLRGQPERSPQCEWPKLLRQPQCLAAENVKRIAPCVPLMQKVCREAPIRAVKMIKFWMELVDPLLSLDPDIKVVHLFRDPRAILHSRIDLISRKNEPESHHIETATVLCELILREISIRKEMEVRYPNTFLELRYEDVASDATVAVQRLYDFIGLAAPEHLKAWVYNSTHAKTSSGKFGTSRTNSSASIAKWRTGLSSRVQKEISEHPRCVELFNYAGYPLQ